MVDPPARVLAPEADRVEDRVVDPVVKLVPCRAKVVLAIAVRGGRATQGDRAQLQVRPVALPVSRVCIPSGRQSVLNPCRGKTAVRPIPTAVVVRVVVAAMVGGGQTPAEGLGAQAIENVSRVSFRRKVSLVRPVFLGRLVERDHLGHRVSQVPRVIQTP